MSGYNSFRDYPKTMDEWIAMVEKYRHDLINTVSKMSWLGMRENVSKDFVGAIDERNHEKMYELLSYTWHIAPDSPNIHCDAVWEILCDLCSEYDHCLEDYECANGINRED